MKPSIPVSEELIAPCGISCAICSRYLAYSYGLKRSQCIGCRPKNQTCAYLFGKCTGINHEVPTGQAHFCFACDQYPCKQINRLDSRYRKNYRMSVRENLDLIHQTGIGELLRSQYNKYRCTRCGGLVSIHNGKCFHCDTVTRLIDKSSY